MGLSQFIANVGTSFREDGISSTARSARYQAQLGALRRISSFISKGEPIWAREWDILLVLDACRLDTMKSLCQEHEFNVGSIWSVGSQSEEWIAKTFSPKYENYSNSAVYLTGNPYSSKVDMNVGELVEAWRYDWMNDPKGINTLPPEPLTDRAIAQWRSTQQSKMIVHYMQPHTPFRSRPEWFGHDHRVNDWGEETESNKSVWMRARDGEISERDLRNAIRDNLEWVMGSVETLLRNVDGKVVLTADHGNALGEYGVWGHPRGLQIPPVRRVPWVETTAKNVENDLPEISDSEVESTVEDQLEALGYR